MKKDKKQKVLIKKVREKFELGRCYCPSSLVLPVNLDRCVYCGGYINSRIEKGKASSNTV